VSVRDCVRDCVLGCVAVSCSVLQCHFAPQRHYLLVLQCVAVRCRVLQCVAVCCSALQCVAVDNRIDRRFIRNGREDVPRCVAACCSMCLHVAACCSVLQWVAEYHRIDWRLLSSATVERKTSTSCFVSLGNDSCDTYTHVYTCIYIYIHV